MATLKNYVSMRHEVTDGELKGREKEMYKIDKQYMLGAYHHRQRRQGYREFVTEYYDDLVELGETCRLKLSKLCDPKNPHPDRVTKFIAAAAPRMASLKGCRSSSQRDKQTKEFGYYCNHPLRAVIFAYLAKVGIEAEEVFDETCDNYAMLKEVGVKYEVVDQALKPFHYSLKKFAKHIGVGKYQIGCIICRLVKVKEVQKRIEEEVLCDVPFDEGLDALEALCPELFALVSLDEANQGKGIRRDENGKIGDVLLCPITQTLLEFWDTPFDKEFPKLGFAPRAMDCLMMAGADDDDDDDNAPLAALVVVPPLAQLQAVEPAPDGPIYSDRMPQVSHMRQFSEECRLLVDENESMYEKVKRRRRNHS
jgi:hypothetical protein